MAGGALTRAARPPMLHSPPATAMRVNAHIIVSTFLVALDLVGTFVFALSGGMVAVKHRLDLFGVLVLSFAAATAGGILRDVLIGAVPPVAIETWHYLAVSTLAGLITFLWYPTINRMRNPVQVFDAVGLALFAVTGTDKALAYGLGPAPAALLGMLTGIGGGMVRDMLVLEIPMVLRADLYAVAALAGAVTVVIGRMRGLPSAATTIAGALLCLILRLLAIRRGWHLPTRPSPSNPE